MNRRTRFIRAKCQRCGRVVGSQYGEADLWTLPPNWPAPLGDYGAFCEDCLARYTQAEWRAWYTRTVASAEAPVDVQRALDGSL